MIETIESQVDSLERRREFLDEARDRLTRFEQTRAAYRAEDVHRYILARTTGENRPRPKPVRV